MGKPAKRGREVDTYEEDDFVENDDGEAPKSKKTKKAAAASSSGAKVEDKTWTVTTSSLRCKLPLLICCLVVFRSQPTTSRGNGLQRHEAH